ncbi:Deoxyuridine 5'-triphosphate nucleotidohydrolase [bioreactor metagenome]|uniref:dUTP diphosphatase n=1 Tax=bioreactor metagenome TaxID=1076179 RepID=A0A644T192_9ZZZZ|nr:dUTP diphosphatase [Negativicutes bacterium]
MRGFEIVDAYRECGVNLPQRKTVYSAGYDIAAAVPITLLPNEVTLVPTGLKAYMESDEYLGIHIRSGLSIRKKIGLINGEGIIDADYYNNPDNEGHIMVAIINYNDFPVVVEKGERIAQGIFYKYLRADYDEETSTIRQGGFGSTGTK